MSDRLARTDISDDESVEREFLDNTDADVDKRVSESITQEYAETLHRLDCEYAAYELALRDPESEESKRKEALDEIIRSL
ncbi:hypothetical protein [Adlercreutzia mucosicola]|uniref:hypothetical protein n=1 Tax=Adlercreutzia mucosicola TaxID=580026 RepID=UPI000483D999|nr:hypothetical protein [Adlercreutzia mucosicola]MCR2035709.1 hypothetical protein [Adlercreutzia mucosicola]